MNWEYLTILYEGILSRMSDLRTKRISIHSQITFLLTKLRTIKFNLKLKVRIDVLTNTLYNEVELCKTKVDKYKEDWIRYTGSLDTFYLHKSANELIEHSLSLIDKLNDLRNIKCMYNRELHIFTRQGLDNLYYDLRDNKSRLLMEQRNLSKLEYGNIVTDYIHGHIQSKFIENAEITEYNLNIPKQKIYKKRTIDIVSIDNTGTWYEYDLINLNHSKVFTMFTVDEIETMIQKYQQTNDNNL